MNRRKIAFYAYLNLKNAEFLDISILMSIWNFLLSLVEHEKKNITSGPGLSMNTWQKVDAFQTNGDDTRKVISATHRGDKNS